MINCVDEDSYILPSGRYTLPVKVKNWNVAEALEEEKREITKYKFDKGRLLCGLTKRMLSNALEEVRLATKGFHIYYERVYQICATNCPIDNKEIYPYENRGLYLSGLISEQDVEYIDTFAHGCLITGSKTSSPLRRNTWLFESVKGGVGEVHYGDDLFIKLNLKPDQSPLYMQACRRDFIGSHYECRLSKHKDGRCRFRVLHVHPRHRELSTGSEIFCKNDFVIQNVSSGRNLAADCRQWLCTLFGIEATIVCRNFKNSNRIETAENSWHISGEREDMELIGYF